MAYSSSLWQWLKASSGHDLTIGAFVVVEGIPVIFTTEGATILPADYIPTGYTGAVVKDLLKIGQGIATITERAGRESGVADTQEIEIALGPDSDDFLLDLFAFAHPDLAESRLVTELTWDGTSIDVDDGTDFAAATEVFIGNETCTVDSVVGDTITLTARAAWGSVANHYLPDDGYYRSPVIVRDRPVGWEGRICRLFLFARDTGGNAIATVRPQEVFAGPIASTPVAEDWQTWAWKVRDYTACLDTELGGFRLTGRLFSSEDYSLLEPEIKKGIRQAWIDEGINDRVEMHVTGYTSCFSGGTVADVDIHVYETLAPGFYADLPAAIQAVVNTALAAQSGPNVLMTCMLGYTSSGVYWPDPAPQTLSADTRVKMVWAWAGVPNQAVIDCVRLEFSIDVDDGSVWQMVGFSAAQSDPVEGAIGVAYGQAKTLYPKLVANELPTVFWYRQGTGTIPVVFDTSEFAQVTQALPSAGFATIAETEVIGYGAVTEPTGDTPFDGCYLLHVSEPAAMGSQPTEYRLQWSWDGQGMVLGATGGAGVKIMWGLAAANVFDLILKAAISTGGNRYPAGDYSAWDTDELPEFFSTPLPGPVFDVNSFIAAKTRFSESAMYRDLAFSEPVKLRELIDEQLKLMGMSLVPRPLADGSYRLSLVDLTDMTTKQVFRLIADGAGGYAIVVDVAAGAVNLTLDDLADKPKISHGLDSLVNRAIVKPCYDVAAEQMLDTTLIFTEEDSRLQYRLLRSQEWQVRGLGTDPGVGEGVAGELILPYLIRMSRRSVLWEFSTDRAGLTLSPGDQVTISCPGLPTPAGSRGIIGQVVTVLQVEKSYFRPGSPICRVTGVASLDGKFSRYAPSGKLTSKGSDGGGNYIELATNEFTTAGTSPNLFGIDGTDYQDSLFFLGSDQIVCWRLGEFDTMETLTVESVDVANSKVYVTAQPSFSVADGNARITFVDWNDPDITTTQQIFAFVGQLTGAKPFKWQ